MTTSAIERIPFNLVATQRLLSDFSTAFMQDAENFIADRVFPVYKTDAVSGEYMTNSKADFMRDEMKEHAPNTVPNRINSGQAKATFTTKEFSVSDIFSQDLLNVFLADMDASARTGGTNGAIQDRAEYLAGKGLLKRESEFVNKFMPATGNPGSTWAYVADGNATASVSFNPADVTGVNNKVLQWTNVNSRPIEDVKFGIRFVQARTGKKPNKLVLAPRVYDALLRHPDVVELISGGATIDRPAISTRALLAAKLDVNEIIVGEAVFNPNDVGLADATNFYLNSQALLIYVPERISLMSVTPGITFINTSRYIDLDPQKTGNAFDIYYAQDRRAYGINYFMSFDQKMVDNSLAYYFTNIIA
jgi:hypothetical protein